MIMLMGLMLTNLGCNKQAASGGERGNANATWSFWQMVQQPLPEQTMLRRALGLDLGSASAPELQTIATLLREAAQACRTRVEQVTAAPVAEVDADAANYGVKKVQWLAASAKWFEALAQQVEKENALTSGETWLLDYMFGLARRADEGEAAWGNALKEELATKAKTFGNLQVDARNIVAATEGLTDGRVELQSAEMQTRILLAKRYGREFPTAEAFAKDKGKPAIVVVTQPSLQAIRPVLMKSLIGKIIRPPSGVWSFDNLSEFQSFEVLSGTNCGNVFDYEIRTQVKGYFSRAEHDFRLLLTGEASESGMKLFFVKVL